MAFTSRHAVVLGLLAAFPSTAASQEDPGGSDGTARFSVDRDHSAAEFVVRFMGLSKVRGRFSVFSGGILYDVESPEHSSVAMSIDVASINTDNDLRDGHLRSPDWFDAERWPTITFTSEAIEQTGADEFLVTGPLTIKETTRVVSIPFTRLHDVQTDAWGNWRIGFEGALTIDRKEFGVEGGNFFNRAFDAARVGVSDEVRIELTISGRIFNMAKIAYRGGEPPSIGAVIEEVYESEGIEAAVRRHEELKRDAPDDYNFGVAGLNTLGYKLLQRGRIEDALEIFRLNLATHPNSGGAMDSLAEAYLMAGDRARAIEFARRSLALEPDAPGTIAMLRWLEGPAAKSPS
jgi:polyisoprenoid-binding protein YceI